jgi:hypothetical protein
MKLWSFQSKEAVDLLKKKAILKVNWDRYRMASWKAAYRWMAYQMEGQGIHCDGHAPIWAWHSCRKWGAPPSIGDASNLLSMGELETGVYTLELTCPDELVLLTDYSTWNILLDHFFDGNYHPQLSAEEKQAFFNIQFERAEQDKWLQATLPFLSLEWIDDIRFLQFDADDKHLNYNELV